jgi:hypothetical protein
VIPLLRFEVYRRLNLSCRYDGAENHFTMSCLFVLLRRHVSTNPSRLRRNQLSLQETVRRYGVVSSSCSSTWLCLCAFGPWLQVHSYRRIVDGDATIATGVRSRAYKRQGIHVSQHIWHQCIWNSLASKVIKMRICSVYRS